MSLAGIKATYAIVYIETEGSQDFNVVWTHILVILVRWSNQLSFEATDVESWSCVGPKEPVRNEFEVIVKYFKYWTVDVKSGML